MSTLPALIGRMEPEYAKTLPVDVDPKKFIRVAQTAIKMTSGIDGVDRNSVFSALAQASQDGLLIDGKEAAIIPFKGKATYIPMVQGMLKRMRQHSEFASISHGIVYQEEINQGRFEYVKGDKEFLRHEPLTLGEKKGDIVGAYAVLTTKSGEKFRAVMDIEAINKRLSKGNNSPAKREWREEFIIKTVLKQLYKIAPNSGDETGVLDGVFGEDQEKPRDVTPQSEPEKKPEITPDSEIDEDGVIKTTKAAAAVMAQVDDIPDAEYTDVPDGYTPPVYDDDEMPL